MKEINILRGRTEPGDELKQKDEIIPNKIMFLYLSVVFFYPAHSFQLMSNLEETFWTLDFCQVNSL